MKKALASIFLFFILTAPSAYAKVKFSSGVEWGYKACTYHKYHYNYLSEEGVRINDKGTDNELFSNGEIYGFAGAYVSDYLNLSLYAGFSGIYSDRRVYPVSARASWYFNGRSCDGLKAFVDLGSAFTDTFNRQKLLLGKAAVGYRFALDKDWGMDLNLCVQYVSDHPDKVIDKYAGTVVTESSLRRCDTTNILFGASVSISF